MNDPSASRLEVGYIARAHGLGGDVVVAPVSNRPERFVAGSRLFRAGSEDEFVIVRARPQQDRWVVHFEGVDDRNAAERLRGTALVGDPLGPAPDGEVWVHELIGCACRDDAGALLGTVDAVQENPAHDLIVLDTGALIPMVFLVEFDADARVVTVRLPEGLLELFEP